MSQAPNNPFDTQPQQLGQPAQQGSNTWLWVLGIIGGLMLVGGLVCCGSIFYLGSKATGFVAEQIVEQYADDPILVEKIGTITSSDMNITETGAESQKDEDFTAMVLDISGDKGSGKLIQRTNIRTNEITVTLVMDNGEEFELASVDEFAGFGEELEGLEELESMEEEIGIEAGVPESDAPLEDTPEATAETTAE